MDYGNHLADKPSGYGLLKVSSPEHNRRLNMHEIERESLLKLFGNCSMTPEYLLSHDVARKQHIKATSWVSMVLDHIIEELQQNDIPVDNAHQAATRVKEAVLDLTKVGLIELDDSHEQFLQVVALRQELAELKCQILEVETESEIVDLQRAIIRRSRNQNVTDAISYLDPDRE
jgi:hypothetical protein